MARKIKEPSEKSKAGTPKSQKKEVAELAADVNPIAVEIPPEFTAQYHSRCGGALRNAREKQGLSVQEIASRLRLSAKQIEAIEADHFSLLPEPTIVRGFIRNYSKLLKINAEPLLDAYNVLVPSATPHQLTVKATASLKSDDTDKGSRKKSFTWILAVLLGIGVWFFYQHFIQKPSPVIPSAKMETTEPLPEVALPAAERSESGLAATEIVLPPTDTAAPVSATPTSTATSEQGVTANKPAEPSTVALQPLPQTEDATAPVTTPAGQESKLELSATQETWISITDGSGREIFSKIIYPGGRESLNVKPPLNVVVGNAGGTSLTFQGKVVDLGPHTRVNVARVKLE